MNKNNEIQQHIHYHYHYTCSEDPLPKYGRDARRKTPTFQYHTPQNSKNTYLSSKGHLYQSIITEEPAPTDRSPLDISSKSQARFANNGKSNSMHQKYFAADRTKDRSQVTAENESNEDQSMHRSNIRSDISLELKVQHPSHMWKAEYEKQIEDLKREVARLQSVQEECLYLRNTYLNHYQNICKDNK